MADKLDGAEKKEADSSVDASGGAMGYSQSQPTPVSLEPDKYNFNHPRRGMCIIINNKNFNKMLTNQNNRDGTDVDAEAVESLFCRLGFDVTRHNDMSCTDISVCLTNASREDHTDADCFACVILSHGEDGVVFGTNGTVPIDRLTKNFKGDACPSLVGKPKLFFIQACRGRRFDHPVEYDETDAGGSHVRTIPTEADFLMAYSVVPGYFSWRNNIDGSWFIQALIKVMQEHGHDMELMQMMTIVNKVVAFDFESCTDKEFTSGMKQVPCVVSMLTKQVYFHPKY